jgi:hypothetical protein
VLSGRTQQRAGPGQVEFKNGVFKANGFVLGQFYSGRTGAYFPVDAQMEPLPGSPLLGEVYDDGDLFNRSMDGVEEAFFALAMAIGKFLSRPLDGIAGLSKLPAGVAALLASSPEYLERFKLMTSGEQIQVVSRLTTTLLTMFAGGGAVSAGLTRGLGGMEVAGLSLSAQGTLALGRVVVPAGGIATVLAAGAGAPIVLQPTAASSQSAAGGVWSLNPFARGTAAERALGRNLPGNFPVIDRFADGVATSIKTIDLGATSYQNIATLTRIVTGYIDEVAAFSGRTWAGVTVRGADITGRALELAIPAGSGTAAQQAALQAAVRYGQSLGVNVTIIPF